MPSGACSIRSLALAHNAVWGVVVLITVPGLSARAQDSWRPYRHTKLTEPTDNLRFRSRDLGVDPQEIPGRRRSVAPVDPRSSPRTPAASEPELSEELLPDREPVSPSNSPPPRSQDFVPAERRTQLAGEEDMLLPSGGLGPTSEYIDEFDLMPPEEEWYLDGAALGGPPLLTKFKDGFFQKLNVQGTVIDPGASSGFALTEFESMLTVAVPAPTKDFPLLISPIFEARFLDGPIDPDLPPILYTTGIDFMWVPKVTDRLRGVISVAPMIYSDFESSDADMFRITGRGIVQWDAIPDRLQFLAGVLYLNRDDVSLLPVAGLIWNPNPYWNLELIFPRPKIARLINYGAAHSDWVYFLGEFGGNTWAVRRDSGLQDKATLRDIRAMLGIERRKNGGANYRFEVGYVFAREIDYSSTAATDFEPADTLLLRVGVTF